MSPSSPDRAFAASSGGAERGGAGEVVTVPWRSESLERLAETGARMGLGFSRPEIDRLRRYFRAEGRDPTDVELAGLAQSWSEHCSYKSSRPFLRRALAGLRPRGRVLGTGDAGVLRWVGGDAYALRIESHNHPSAIEPYGGAATGIGGILRDVLAVGAQPVALADPLYFGPLDLPPERVPRGLKTPRYLFDGVVAGIRDYGNRVGVPTVAGSIGFDPAFVANPLVNVGCVGVLPRRRLRPNRATAVGERLVLAGGRTGRDGIGGVAFASRELSEQSETESRGAVQLGNPIEKEPLIHACVEAYDQDLVRGVKDLGGGGLATASGELVHAGGFASRIALDRVPLRESGLRPWEVWISESQERMLLAVRPRDLEAVFAIFGRHDVLATDIGEVAPAPFESITWQGREVARLRVGFRVDPPPLRRPTRRRRRPGRSSGATTRPDDDLTHLVPELSLAPDALSRESVIRVYDHEVMGRTAIKPLHGRIESPTHGDAAVLRPRPDRWAGLAVAVASDPWAGRIDPERAASLTVEEAARNLYAVGARPDAFADCLNFANPEDPYVLGDFAASLRGLARAARRLGFAIPSGNVSFYNAAGGDGIPPTPVLLAVGLVDDVRRAVTADFKRAGNPVYLIGRSSEALGGSLWARRTGQLGLPLPPSDPALVGKLGRRLLAAWREVRAAHDVSEGGLASALLEMAFGAGLGLSVDLAATGLSAPGVAAAAEGASRWVVEVDARRESAFRRRFAGFPVARLGAVAPEPVARFGWRGREVGRVDLLGLYPRWRTGLEALGPAEGKPRPA